MYCNCKKHTIADESGIQECMMHRSSYKNGNQLIIPICILDLTDIDDNAVPANRSVLSSCRSSCHRPAILEVGIQIPV